MSEEMATLDEDEHEDEDECGKSYMKSMTI